MTNIFKKSPHELKNHDHGLTEAEIAKLPKHIRLFAHTPVWKTILVMSIPAVIIMFVMGAFMFSDSLLAINFAGDSYQSDALAALAMKGKDYTQIDPSAYTADMWEDIKDMETHLVRLYMTGGSPISMLITAFALFFGVGMSTRFAINMGRGNKERAMATLKTGFMSGMVTSFILIPILIFSAKPWIHSQLPDGINSFQSNIDNTFSYIWIIILGAPLTIFNQMMTSSFRNEARNREAMIAMIIPILLNILLDWVFMGPAGMGVDGGAWATFISYATTSLFLVIMIFVKKNSVIRFSNLIGYKLSIVMFFGIALVGIAPFFRNMAQTITQTVEMSVVQGVSSSLYTLTLPDGTVIPDADHMQSLMVGAGPVFALFFPAVFGFTQAATPVMSYNYGARNYKRVKQAFNWTMIYSTVAGLIFFGVAMGLAGPLMEAQGIHNRADAIYPHQKSESIIMLAIWMLSTPLFGIALGGMTLFASTDRIISSIISTTLRGIIFFFPMIFIFKAIAIGAGGEGFAKYTFWWFYPVMVAMTSGTIYIMSIFTFRSIASGKPQPTIDERVEKFNAWVKGHKDKITGTNRTKVVANTTSANEALVETKTDTQDIKMLKNEVKNKTKPVKKTLAKPTTVKKATPVKKTEVKQVAKKTTTKTTTKPVAKKATKKK